MRIIKTILVFAAVMLMSTIMYAATSHTVKHGETLMDIAAMYDTTPLELSVANNIDFSSELKPGQKLLIVKLSDEEILNGIASDKSSKKKPAKSKTAKKTSSKTAKKTANKDSGKGNKSIVSFAMGLKNSPYVSGGTSRGGFDCSGFTYYVYKHFGKTIPRTSAGQFRGGKAVSKNNLQKGDIVCFHTHRSGCSHVGIYIGNGKFIHASTPKTGVIVSELNGVYYGPRYLGARRY